MDAPPVHVVLVEPEIPQNTGNIARTCAATGAHLHLVEPLGFTISDRYLRRAGLDYWHLVEVHRYPSLDAFLRQNEPNALLYITKKGRTVYTDASFSPGCFLVFGRESEGLPQWLLDSCPERTLRIPMVENARSLNLSNAVAILVYEALRCQGFPGLTREPPAP
jgi:tRNA (cytidine/uridine-2'-O-)-methyltransferase